MHTQRSEFLLPYVGSSSHYTGIGDTLFAECLEISQEQNLEHSAKIRFAECLSQQKLTLDSTTILFVESRTLGIKHTVLNKKKCFDECPTLGKLRYSPKGCSLASSRYQLTTVNYGEWHKEALDKRSAFAKFDLQTLSKEGFCRMSFPNTRQSFFDNFLYFCPSPKLFSTMFL